MILRMANLKFGSRMGFSMKAIGNFVTCKVKERFIFTTVISTKAASKETRCTATVCLSFQMAILIKETSKNIGGMDKESISGRMVIFITVPGKLVKGTEKVNKRM